MNADAQSLIQELIEGAFSTIATDVALLGFFGAALSIFGVLLFKIITNAIAGPVTDGRWSHTWKVIWVGTVLLLPIGGFVIGGGQGFIHGSERALRDSEFGRQTLPSVTNHVVDFYAVIYFMDPEGVKGRGLSDIASLRHLDEIREFRSGTRPLETAQLKDRLSQIDGPRLSEMARTAREDFARMTEVLGGEFDGLSRASKIVLEYAAAPPEIEGTPSDLLGPFYDIESAAALHGDPSQATRAELAEHLTEDVAIPGLMAPIRLFVRPWQIGAGIIMGLLFLLLLLTRIAASSPIEEDG